jgi:ribosomal protein S18 acetylase RimI-like enzyme
VGRISAPEPLTMSHQIINFDCGSASLNEWLGHRALKNEHSGGSRTYVVCDNNRVIGYYAIAAGSVARSEVTNRIKKNMPDPIPALVLGRLAVDCNWQGQNIGRGLLKDALARSINVSEQVGARVLIVHVMNDKAEAFYRKYGFTKKNIISNILMLPL